jgi:nucleoside-diphosphate-sugar epimerase
VLLKEMNKKVLVTGASGLTGGHLARRLLQKGYNVKALVRKTSNISELKNLDIEIVFGDLTERDSLIEALKGVDIVYHIAAAFRKENLPKKVFWAVNVQGTKNILEASLNSGVKRFIHCSTVGVHGRIAHPPANENSPYNPGDNYQKSKTEGEKLARQFFEQNRLPGVIVRPVGIYGPGDTRFLKLFKFIQSQKFIMFGNGKVLYHLTYIDDLVEGFLLCGEKETAVGNTYIIGGEEYLSLNRLCSIIAKALNVPLNKRHLPFWPLWMASFLCEILCKPLRIEPPLYRRRLDFFSKDRAFDISKAKEDLGYTPKFSLERGIALTVDWYRQQGLLPRN